MFATLNSSPTSSTIEQQCCSINSAIPSIAPPSISVPSLSQVSSIAILPPPTTTASSSQSLSSSSSSFATFPSSNRLINSSNLTCCTSPPKMPSPLADTLSLSSSISSQSSNSKAPLSPEDPPQSSSQSPAENVLQSVENPLQEDCLSPEDTLPIVPETEPPPSLERIEESCLSQSSSQSSSSTCTPVASSLLSSPVLTVKHPLEPSPQPSPEISSQKPTFPPTPNTNQSPSFASVASSAINQQKSSSQCSTSTNDSSVKPIQPITAADISKLLKLFSVSSYEPDRFGSPHDDACMALFARDYPAHVIITNFNAELAKAYPAKIFIPETNEFMPYSSELFDSDSYLYPRANTYSSPPSSQSLFASPSSSSSRSFSPFFLVPPNHPSSSKSPSKPTNASFKTLYARNAVTKKLDPVKVKEVFQQARLARCRARFPVPVIVYKNRFICRSGTLAGSAEILSRRVYEYCTANSETPPPVPEDCPNLLIDDQEFDGTVMVASPPRHSVPSSSKSTPSKSPSPNGKNKHAQRSQSADGKSAAIANVCSHFRGKDIDLLKFWNVGTILDLMLEKKKVKCGLNISSSEKVDKEKRYSNFDIYPLPYPGCEFFREYRDNNYTGEGLVYNWNQAFVNQKFVLPRGSCEELKQSMGVDFDDYQKWDINTLTQNYMKLLLKILRESEDSMLLHCISGWDRTPLFISLLRLTLWADGEIHKSLSPLEMTYLTLAYDWYLFGHQLTDRLARGEEIMFFCFQFLKHLCDDEYSINYMPPLGEASFNKDFHPRFRSRLDSVDSTDKNDFVLPDDVVVLGTSASSSSNHCSPPHMIPSHPVATHNPYDVATGLHRLKLNHDNGLSGSMCILDEDELCDKYTKNSESSDDMTSTLTEEATEDFFGSAESRPMAIPASKQPPSLGIDITKSSNSKQSLQRNDSWQVVSDAGSIRDNYLVHQFSSPDSLNYSPRKTEYLTDSPLFSRNHFSQTVKNNPPINLKISPKMNCIFPTKSEDRVRKLMEVRAIFNSAYTSSELEKNHRGFSHIVENIVSPFLSSCAKDSPKN